MVKKNQIRLGESSLYQDQYDSGLLEPIPRVLSRSSLPGLEKYEMSGWDLWNAYELSWLNDRGLPQVAIARFIFDASSDAIIESKSFKYYLNSLNQTRFPTREVLVETLTADLSSACGGQVSVSLSGLDEAVSFQRMEGVNVDSLVVDNLVYEPVPELLQVEEENVVDESLYSHLLKSNCPVTGQPDWATVWIKYSGNKISAESFLRYVVSFRKHQDFHENCVEKMFFDLVDACACQSLSIYARYTRRGGLDINPFRTNADLVVPEFRVVRQ